LLAAGWTIVRGTRSVAHPVPPASRLISIERQRGNADDALMRALHGARWRHRAHAAPGRRPLHIATTAAAVTAIAALLLRRGALAKAALSGWGAGTLELAIARVRPGPRTGDEIATMALTSALLPPTATAHWLLGLLRWRVLSRPRPLPTRGPIDEQHEGGEAPPALPHRAVIVLGYHEVRHGRHLLDRVGRAVVRRAESLVAEQAPRAVIFTGWSSRPGPSEAEQMDDLWKGRRDIALIREPRARNTAENATRCLELVKSLDGVSEVVVVCSIRHFPRVRYLFGRLYASEGIAVRYSYVTSPLPSGRLVWHELGSLTRMALDLQRAQAGRPA
jgi:hypothetical protein